MRKGIQMKKKILALLLAVACMILPVVGCGNIKCDNHVDEDGDGICDNCAGPMICEVHTDANGDFVCDVCGSATNTTCDAHTDADGNLACDRCGATLTGGCNPHLDENADSYCDVCHGAIVIQTQVAAPREEARVEMVVNTIPTDVAIGSYINTTPEGTPRPMTGTALSAGTLCHGNRFLLTQSEESYALTDLLSGVKVMEVSKGADVVRLTVTPEERYVLVTTEYTNGRVSDSYYAYVEGVRTEPFCVQDVNTASVRGFHNETELNNGLISYQLDERLYIFRENELLFAGLDQRTFVDRPSFTYSDESYGYVLLENQIFAYDLSAWMNCTYSYTIPSYYEEPACFLLENGTLLLQASVQLADSAVSYDYLKEGSKYDLVYMILDPAAKTATKTEFGYYIFMATAQNVGGVLTAEALNLVVAYPIVDDRIDSHTAKTLITDNGLKILADLELLLRGAAKGEEVLFLPGDLILAALEVAEGSYVHAMFTMEGEFICYLPDSADLSCQNYVKYNGKRYSYRMEELPDIEAAGYTVVGEYAGYGILSKVNGEGVTEYFYYNGSNAALISVEGGSGVTLVHNDETGFRFSYSKDGQTEYAFRDAANHTVLTAKADGEPIKIDGTDAYLIATNDGALYLVK